jgi:hypothetical protein
LELKKQNYVRLAIQGGLAVLKTTKSSIIKALKYEIEKNTYKKHYKCYRLDYLLIDFHLKQNYIVKYILILNFFRNSVHNGKNLISCAFVCFT